MTQSFLIADDSEGKMFFLESILKHFAKDIPLIKAHTTEEAKKSIDDNPSIAYAFIDYEMPSENGPAVIEYLRGKSPDSRIALVTAFTSEQYKTEALEKGANAFVSTAYAEDEVVSTLKDLLIEWDLMKG